MSTDSHPPVPGYRRLLSQAVPIILANATTPLLSLTDIAVIGHFGSAVDLAAIALGGLLFSFLFWGFGFLRMNTSGPVAQARGRENLFDMVSVVLRGLFLAMIIGVLLLLLQWPVITLALQFFGAEQAVENIARDYFYVRIWSAPATLSLYVLMGFFIGSGASRSLLAAQLLLNGLNIGFDIFFAGVMGWGAAGIALGTALAEWLALVIIALMIWRQRRKEIVPLLPQLFSALRDRQKMHQLLVANGDIMVRTLALIFGFALFTDQGARLGVVTLAANHILLQLVSFSAFFLDGFAFVTEAHTGRAFGAGDRRGFTIVVRRTSLLAAATAVGLAVVLWCCGALFVTQLTNLPLVREVALNYLPFAAVYVLLSFAAFQLDGVFIGASQSRALRNAALWSTAILALLIFPLADALGNTGLWLAFILFVVARAVMLGMGYKSLVRKVGEAIDG